MKKSTIVLSLAVVICLGLSVISAYGSVGRTKDAITQLAKKKVTYTKECKEEIDRAVSYYKALDPNLDLTDKITNKKEFDTVKIEYVRLAIKAASVADARKMAEGYTSSDVKKFVTEARDTMEAYLTKSQYELVENYADLLTLEAVYSSSGGSGGSSDEEAAAVPMC